MVDSISQDSSVGSNWVKTDHHSQINDVLQLPRDWFLKQINKRGKKDYVFIFSDSKMSYWSVYLLSAVSGELGGFLDSDALSTEMFISSPYLLLSKLTFWLMKYLFWFFHDTIDDSDNIEHIKDTDNRITVLITLITIWWKHDQNYLKIVFRLGVYICDYYWVIIVVDELLLLLANLLQRWLRS